MDLSVMSGGSLVSQRTLAAGALFTRPNGHSFSCRREAAALAAKASGEILNAALLAPSINGTGFKSSSSVLEARPSYLDQRRCVEMFLIRSYEVGANRKATMETIASLLQEVACNHARSVGFSIDGFATTLSMRKHGLIWVMTRMHIEVEEYPIWGDTIEIETWFQFEGRIGTRRDWRITNAATGRVLARATSTWALMNQETRRLSRINEDVRDEFSLYVTIPPRWVFTDDASLSKKQIPKLELYDFVKEKLQPARSDLDMNQHVNNITYIRWVLESLPEEVANTHHLHSLTLEFRRECKQDDTVCTSASKEECSDSFSNDFVHLIKLAGCNKEISRSRTSWRNKV